MVLALAACGGETVTGEVGKACIAADRRAATPALCSCVQQAANRTLNAADQRVAASFFASPQTAQDIRQSNNRSNEAFWDRYKAFTEFARAQCG